MVLHQPFGRWVLGGGDGSNVSRLHCDNFASCSVCVIYNRVTYSRITYFHKGSDATVEEKRRRNCHDGRYCVSARRGDVAGRRKRDGC